MTTATSVIQSVDTVSVENTDIKRREESLSPVSVTSGETGGFNSAENVTLPLFSAPSSESLDPRQSLNSQIDRVPLQRDLP